MYMVLRQQNYRHIYIVYHFKCAIKPGNEQIDKFFTQIVPYPRGINFEIQEYEAHTFSIAIHTVDMGESGGWGWKMTNNRTQLVQQHQQNTVNTNPIGRQTIHL